MDETGWDRRLRQRHQDLTWAASKIEESTGERDTFAVLAYAREAINAARSIERLALRLERTGER